MLVSLADSRTKLFLVTVAAIVLSLLIGVLSTNFDIIKVVWVIGGALLGLWVVLRPDAGVPVVAGLIPFPFYSDRFLPDLGSNEFLVVALLAVTVGAGAARGRLVDTRPFRTPILLFLLGGLLGSFHAADTYLAVLWLGRWALAFGWMWVLIDWTTTPRRLLLLTDVMLLSVVGAGLLGIFQYLGGPVVVPQYTTGRIDSTFGFTNVFGSYLLLTLVFLAAVISDRSLPPFGRAIRLAGLALGATALLLTYSRGALVGAVAGLTLAIWFHEGRRRQVISIAAVLTAGIGATLAMSGDLRATFLNRFESLTHPATESVRVIIWTVALRAIPVTTPLGLGFGNFKTILPSQVEAEWLPTQFYHPHNLELALYFETGILGLTAFAWLLARGFARSFRLRNTSIQPTKGIGAGAFGALAGLCVQCLVDYTLQEFALLLTFTSLLALIVAAQNIARGTQS